MSIVTIFGPARHHTAARDSWGERRRRRMVARGWTRLLADARRPDRGLTARVPFERDQVRDAAAEIERLVARLCDDEHPVPAAELAAARDLACDANGPVFAWTEPGTFRRRLRVLSEAMG